MNQKSTVKLVLVGIMILLLAVGSYFAWAKKKKAEPFAPETSQVDTSNWQTYRNDKYGFEFKYPTGWDFQENPNANSEDVELVSAGDEYYGGVTVYLLPVPIESYVGNDGLTYQRSQEILGGKSVVSKTGYVNGELSQKNFIVKFDSTTAVIHVVPFGNHDTYSDQEKWKKLDQIISTFKFTKPEVKADTSEWKTYTNDKLGFSVQYPPQLKPREEFDITYGAAPTVFFDYPAISDYGPHGNVIYAFYVIYSTDLKSLYQFKSDPGYYKWEDKGVTTVDGVTAQKFFSPNSGFGSTAYLIQTKNIAITFISPEYSQISSSDLNKILSTFKFTK